MLFPHKNCWQEDPSKNQQTMGKHLWKLDEIGACWLFKRWNYRGGQKKGCHLKRSRSVSVSRLTGWGNRVFIAFCPHLHWKRFKFWQRRLKWSNLFYAIDVNFGFCDNMISSSNHIKSINGSVHCVSQLSLFQPLLGRAPGAQSLAWAFEGLDKRVGFSRCCCFFFFFFFFFFPGCFKVMLFYSANG